MSSSNISNISNNSSVNRNSNNNNNNNNNNGTGDTDRLDTPDRPLVKERGHSTVVVLLDVRFILSVTLEACHVYRTTSDGTPKDLQALMVYNSQVALKAKDKRCAMLWKLLSTGAATSVLDVNAVLESANGNSTTVRNARGHAVTWYTHPIGGRLFKQIWALILEEGHLQMAAVLSCAVSTYWCRRDNTYRRFAYGYDMFKQDHPPTPNAAAEPTVTPTAEQANFLKKKVQTMMGATMRTTTSSSSTSSATATSSLLLDGVRLSEHDRIIGRLHELVLNYGKDGHQC